MTSATSRTTAEGRPVGELLMVRGKPLREYLDPVGSAAWSNEVSDQVADPTDRMGDWIADAESKGPEKSEREKFDSFRKKFNRERESLVDTAGKTTSRLQDIMAKRPPTGHLETRTGPEMSPAPVHGLDAGDVLASGLAAGIMTAEGIRKIREKLSQTRRR